MNLKILPLVILLFFQFTFGQTVTTFAGFTGSFGVFCGTIDGTGSAARFCGPSGITVDVSGNFYVADSNNHTIRKITAAGVVSTFAGEAGTIGNKNNTNIFSPANFHSPSGVAVDALGNVYVADTSNNLIRKISATGWVSYFAGSGTAGSIDGTGTAAKFNTPTGVAVDALGNVYVADRDNHTIRKITPAGEVSTLAGSAGIFGSTDGIGTDARFYFPSGLAVDALGNVYVADFSNNTIRKITSAGVVTTLAGSAGIIGSMNGTGTMARFGFPNKVALDASGNVFVTDGFNHTIRKITAAGVVSTLAGSTGTSGSTDGIGTAARFFGPNGVAVDASGNIYVADSGNSRIRKITGIPLGNAKFEIVSKLNIYPNPVASLLQIQTPNNITLDKVCIIDLSGKKVLEQTQNASQIDVAHLANGMYIIEAFSGEEKFSSKFMKE